MSTKKPGFMVYHANEPIVESLNLRQRGELLTALFEYSQTGKHTPCKGMVEAVFQVMKSGMDKDRERYEQVCAQNKKRIQKRWKKDTPETARDKENTEEYGVDTEKYGVDTERYGVDTERYGKDTDLYGEDTETIRNDTNMNMNRNETEYETEYETEIETEYETETETETLNDASDAHTHPKQAFPQEKHRKTEKTRETRETGVCAGVCARVCAEETFFESFWKLYPRKSEAKETARKVFLSRNFDEKSFEQLMNRLQKAISSPQWHLEDGRFIPRASVWLAEHRDEPITLPQNPHDAPGEPDEDVYEQIRKRYAEEMGRG